MVDMFEALRRILIDWIDYITLMIIKTVQYRSTHRAVLLIWFDQAINYGIYGGEQFYT